MRRLLLESYPARRWQAAFDICERTYTCHCPRCHSHHQAASAEEVADWLMTHGHHQQAYVDVTFVLELGKKSDDEAQPG